MSRLRKIRSGVLAALIGPLAVAAALIPAGLTASRYGPGPDGSPGSTRDRTPARGLRSRVRRRDQPLAG
jgi:hypothetical protein